MNPCVLFDWKTKATLMPCTFFLKHFLVKAITRYSISASTHVATVFLNFLEVCFQVQ